jgi:hypothetical protein
VDYLQHAARRGAPADYRLAVAALSDEIVRYARDHHTSAICVSSVARGRFTDESADNRDAASSPKESGDVEYDAAAVLRLDVGERDADGTAPTRLIVGKSRYGTDGVVGLRFDGRVGIFRPDQCSGLPELDREVLEAIGAGSIWIEDIAKAVGKRRRQVEDAIKRLARSGQICPAGPRGGWVCK